MQESCAENITLFNGLNPSQKEAVEITEGSLLVLAGAGTGKTKVLTSRIAWLLMKGVFPAQILAVTFTNKASREMALRVSSIVGYQSQGLWLGTFHSIATRILRRHTALVGLKDNFTIIDSDDQLRLIKHLLKEHDIDEKRFQPKILQHIINRWKDRGLLPHQIRASEDEYFGAMDASRLYTLYQQKLQQLNACDFGDLLLQNLRLFTEHPHVLAQYHHQFRYILVDEYQDTNIAQYLWLRLLSQQHKNLCCVGDDDQSIYGWRGAEVGNILKFEKDFPDAAVIRLERNYRSTSHILSAASALIAKNKSRLGKTLWTEGNEGIPIKLVALWDDSQEAEFIADEITALSQNQKVSLREIAILVRAGFQTRPFEECFIRHGISYKVIGGLRFYERMEIKDIIAYLRIIMQPDDDLALERVINTPKRGIGLSTLDLIRNTARAQSCSMVRAITYLIETGGLKGKTKQVLESLLASFSRWKLLFSDMAVPEAAEMVARESGYLQMWEAEKSLESEGRTENIKELLRALTQFESIAQFLEYVSLVTDVDEMNEEAMVNIMTLHAAKGLEFEAVFLPGWEQGLFPHQKSMDEKGDSGVEEERRLAYVGITRAKHYLYITFAAGRRIYGQWQNSIPSVFVSELPEENVDMLNNVSGLRYTPQPQKQSLYMPSVKTTPSSSEYRPGNRVFHQKFGYGTVLSVQDGQLDISFDKAGKKKVLQEYVNRE